MARIFLILALMSAFSLGWSYKVDERRSQPETVSGQPKQELRHRIVLGDGGGSGRKTLVVCDPPTEPNPIPITQPTGFTITLEEADCAAQNQLREEMPEWIVFTDDVRQDVGKHWHVGPYNAWTDSLLVTILSRSATPGVKYGVREDFQTDSTKLYFEDYTDMDCNDVVVSITSHDSIRNLQLIMPPGFDSVPPESTIEGVVARVTDDMDQPIPNFRIALGTPWKCNTGGHIHCPGPTKADSGSFPVPDTGWTDAAGELEFDFVAGIHCGIDSLKACGRDYLDAKDAQEISIMIDNTLYPMPVSLSYTLTGGRSCHPDTMSHWALQSTNSTLIGIAEDYLDSVNLPVRPRGSHVCYDDMSLPWGGKFDINCSWAGDHNAHRLGTNCDVKQFCCPQGRTRNTLWDIIVFRGGDILVEGPNYYWHVTF
jgi:hypothetical protein